MNDTIPATGHLLGAADIRRIAADAGISPTKKFGQNFVIDPGTVRRIVREAGVTAADHVMEVGPGLGSLTLAILETGATMTAVEIDPPLAERLPGTVAEFMPEATSRLTVVNRDALTVAPENVPDFSDDASFTLVANLPYNVGHTDSAHAIGAFRQPRLVLGDGAKRGGRQTRRQARFQHLRHAEREARLVWHRRTGGHHRPQCVLAGSQCGFRARRIHPVSGR